MQITSILLALLIHGAVLCNGDRHTAPRQRRNSPPLYPPPLPLPPPPIYPYPMGAIGYYGDHCAAPELLCAESLVCNEHNLCDCPNGYSVHHGRCVKRCQANNIPINDTCFPVKSLNQDCQFDDQCAVPYSRCTDGRCRCIAGVTELGQSCVYTPRCIVGQPLRDARGRPTKCTNNADCPDTHMCWLIADANGYCCPEIDIQCPVGEQLIMEGNFSAIPYSKYYTYMVMIGSNTRSLLCPHACPPALPIEVNNKCHARAGYGDPCEYDVQCTDMVYNSACKVGANGLKTCACANSSFTFVRGQCTRESGYGGPCSGDMDCQLGTNTYCHQGTCQCHERYMPDPHQSSGGGGNRTIRCIGDPMCPSKNGMQLISDYTDCSADQSACGPNEYCRIFWYEPPRNYRMCCKKPSTEEYEALCKQLGMQTQYKDANKLKPIKCTMEPYPPTGGASLFSRSPAAQSCPRGTHCIFNPYEDDNPNEGVCCKVKGVKTPMEWGNFLGPVQSPPPRVAVGLDDLNGFH